GTHGKTTTTCLAAFLLRENGIDAGWLIGGIPTDLPEGGSNLGKNSAPFVIEGDEYDTAFFDKRSKFLHYRPRVLLINNIEFDHADIFRDLTDVKRTFTHVRRIVSPLGLIVENGDDQNIASLEATPWVRRMTVGTSDSCDVKILDFHQKPDSSSFTIEFKGKRKSVEWNLPGIYNARNAAMAIVGAAEILGKEPLDIDISSLSKFRGVKRRQEIILDTPNLKAIEDFGHHPTALKLTIESLRQKYPDYKLVACLSRETLQRQIYSKTSLPHHYPADAAYVGAVNANKIEPSRRMDTKALAEYNPKR
ncbi:MAG: Mur ligase family protein, partial [Bacilli bacterium]